MLHSEVASNPSILSSILILVLVLVLYSFGEFRSISFAFTHLLIKWPTTLQAPAAVASCCCCKLLSELLLLLLLSLSQLSSFGLWNCLTNACGNVAVAVLVVAGSAGDTRWPGFATRQVQVCYKIECECCESCTANSPTPPVSRSSQAAHKSHNGNLIQ